MSLHFRFAAALLLSIPRTRGPLYKAFLSTAPSTSRLIGCTVALNPAAPVDPTDANRWIDTARSTSFAPDVVGPLSTAYMGLPVAHRSQFLLRMVECCGLANEEPISAGASTWDLKGLWTLRTRLRSPYERWFHQVLPMDNGLLFLIALRADLLKFTASEGRLSYMLNCLTEFLQNCMHPGWIHLRSLTATEPDGTLDVLQNGDAVHPILSRTVLSRRLPPTPFRRCHALFHTFEPTVPLAFIQTALLPAPPSAMSAIFEDKADDGTYPRTSAIFYSINSTQGGLARISIGQLLIKAVALQLQREGIAHFCTLSPLPGFRRWLAREVASIGRAAVQHRWTGLLAPEMTEDIQAACHILGVPGDGHPLVRLVAALNTNAWVATPSAMARIEKPLTYVALVYLTQLYHQRVPDPVQHFHLGNGACLWRVNFAADLSEKRLGESYGLMANYYYDLPRIEAQAQQYQHAGTVPFGEPCRGQMRGYVLPCIPR
eukprot:EG_transcript_9247